MTVKSFILLIQRPVQERYRGFLVANLATVFVAAIDVVVDTDVVVHTDVLVAIDVVCGCCC